MPAYKLVDVPELGYTTKDKPYPRGELRLKTKRMITGYYKHPEVGCLPFFLCSYMSCLLSTGLRHFISNLGMMRIQTNSWRIAV